MRDEICPESIHLLEPGVAELLGQLLTNWAEAQEAVAAPYLFEQLAVGCLEEDGQAVFRVLLSEHLESLTASGAAVPDQLRRVAAALV